MGKIDEQDGSGFLTGPDGKPEAADPLPAQDGGTPDLAPPVGLIAQAKSRDSAAWERLVRSFGPMIYAWTLEWGLKCEDARDMVQDVFVAILEHIAGLDEKVPDRRFLAWLKTVARNKVRDRFRARCVEGEAPGGSWALWLLGEVPERAPAEGADGDHRESEDRALDREAVQLGRAGVEDRTWEAFWRLAVNGPAAEEVAAELGMTVNAVYHAKSRVRRSIRRERERLSH